MKVLIVEDHESTLTLLRIALSRPADFQISGALDASQALKALEETPFDWLIVDGQISPIDGFELSAKAKAIQPRIKIVMISGIYEPADIAGYPINKLFQKPLDVDALAAYLRKPIMPPPT